jgi:hypothetical protein
MGFEKNELSHRVTLGLHSVDAATLIEEWATFIDINLESYQEYLPLEVLSNVQQAGVVLAYSLGEYLTFVQKIVFDDPMTRFVMMTKLIHDSPEIMELAEITRTSLLKKYYQ